MPGACAGVDRGVPSTGSTGEEEEELAGGGHNDDGGGAVGVTGGKGGPSVKAAPPYSCSSVALPAYMLIPQTS